MTKHYRDLVAVNNVNLGIEAGECFGLLGPNGAGKTTLVRMLTAASPPTSGSIFMLGKDLANDSRQVKAVLGVIPQLDNLDPDLSVRQNLITFARYFAIKRREAIRRSEELLRLFKLEDKRNNRIMELSGGMKRRLLLARGLINNPEILILDEPTIGLDPQSKYLVWHKLTEFKARGMTQLLCTQNMEEAEALCDRVAIMHQGSILSVDSPGALISRYVGKSVFEIEMGETQRDRIIQELTTRGIEFEDAGRAIHVFHGDDNDSIKELAGLFEKVKHRPGTLEDVFLHLTGRTLTE